MNVFRIGLFLTLVVAPRLMAEPPPPIYDEKADASQEIAAALEKARKNNQRVLLMYGGNWCGWCHKLHDLFEKNREIGRILLYEYRLVMVDIGRSDKHMDIVENYGAQLRTQGVPYLTVLDARGKVLANQDTGSLEKGDLHDPEKVKAFLSKWVAEPVDARDVYKEALERASKEKKRLLVHLGAPW